jgi:hypothetical protein
MWTLASTMLNMKPPDTMPMHAKTRSAIVVAFMSPYLEVNIGQTKETDK